MEILSDLHLSLCRCIIRGFGSRNAVLEIRSGVGGEEAALFAHSLLRMYTMYAQRRGWKAETVGLNETELRILGISHAGE